MTKADDYFAKARHSAALAEACPDAKLRAEYQRLADGWLIVAEQQVALDGTAADARWAAAA